MKNDSDVEFCTLREKETPLFILSDVLTLLVISGADSTLGFLSSRLLLAGFHRRSCEDVGMKTRFNPSSPPAPPHLRLPPPPALHRTMPGVTQGPGALSVETRGPSVAYGF